jgi:hypothetical protein
MGSDFSTTATTLTGYAIAPVVITFIVVHLLVKNVTQAKAWPLFGVSALIGIGIPSFLTLWWPGLANSLKKKGNDNIDSSLAGTWISVALMLSLITCFFTYWKTQGPSKNPFDH